MKYKRITPEIKAFDDALLWIEHFISTEERDRGGDIMSADGMKMNGVPVVLWQHGLDPMYGHMPIAKPLEFKVGKNKKGVKGIVAKTQFPNDEEGVKMYKRVKENFLPNWSIGYDGKGVPLDGGGMRYDEWELFEYSSVAIPMNAGATHGEKPEMKQLAFKYIVEKAPEGYKDAYEFLEKTEPVEAIEGFTEPRKDKETGKVYGKKEGEWHGVLADPPPAQEPPTEAPAPDAPPAETPAVAPVAEDTGGQTKSLADEVKGDVAWTAMMIITDKLFSNVSRCEPKKSAVRKLFEEYGETMTGHALAYCEYVAENQQSTLIEKMETFIARFKEAAEPKENPAETPQPEPEQPAEEPAPPEQAPVQDTEEPPEPEKPKALTAQAFKGERPKHGITIGEVKQLLAEAVVKNNEQVQKQIRKAIGRLD